jgi:hypothetical protein
MFLRVSISMLEDRFLLGCLTMVLVSRETITRLLASVTMTTSVDPDRALTDVASSCSDDTPQASPLPLLRSDSVKSEGSRPVPDPGQAASLRVSTRSGSLPAVEVRLETDQSEEVEEGVNRQVNVCTFLINIYQYLYLPFTCFLLT